MAAAAVIITDDHRRLTEDLEKQELDSPGGVANGPLQLKLLAAYLLQNDLSVSALYRYHELKFVCLRGENVFKTCGKGREPNETVQCEVPLEEDAADSKDGKFKVQRYRFYELIAVPELGLVWNVGQKLWQRDFPGMYAALSQEWSESVAQMMQALTETTRRRAILLVSRAYSSISVADFAGFVGLASDQAVQLAIQHGWQVDENADIVYPSALPAPPASSTPSNEQLMKLTEFVTFLEN